MRGWWIPASAVAGGLLVRRPDRARRAARRARRASSSTTLDGADRAHLDRQLLHVRPGQLPELPRLQHQLRPRSATCAAPTWQLEGTTVAPEFVVGALANGVPRCFAVTRRERGRVRERPVAAPLGHAAPRRPERRALRVRSFRRRAAGSGSGTTSTATAASRTRELGLVRVGHGARHRLLRGPGRRRAICSSRRCAPAPGSSTTTTTTRWRT